MGTPFLEAPGGEWEHLENVNPGHAGVVAGEEVDGRGENDPGDESGVPLASAVHRFAHRLTFRCERVHCCDDEGYRCPAVPASKRGHSAHHPARSSISSSMSM